MPALLFALKYWRVIASIVGVVALLGGVQVIYSRGYGEAAAVLQPKIDVLLGVVRSDELTIKQLQADAKVNDELLAEYSDAVTILNKKASDDQLAIQRLQRNDKSVSAYLDTAIPDALRRLLNDDAASPGGKGETPAAPKGVGSALPGPAKR